MAKNVIYLELSQGNVSNGFYLLQEYKYGKSEEFKTLTSAMNKATKDFKKQAKIHFDQSFKWIGTRNALRITSPLEEGILIHNQIEINS